MEHSLVLGSLDLDEREPTDDGYSFAVLADGLSFGVAQGVKEIVTSLLADGDLTRTTRYGNREVTFVVEIEGSDLAAVASGEVALRREIGRRNTLTWIAPDGFAVPTVFDVLDSEMTQKFDDLDELRRKRTFAVTLTCAPFARSAELVTVPALIPPGSVVSAVVNNADTTTGWSASIEVQDGFSRVSSAVTVTDQGDFVQATGTGILPSLSLGLTAAGVDMTPTPYLTVETSGTPGQKFFRDVSGSRVRMDPVMARATGTTTTLYVFDMTGATFTNLVVTNNRTDRASQSVTINVHNISRTNALDQVTPYQQSRIIQVGGTERTPASIQVSPNEAVTLGFTIVHTYPEDGSGYSPPLRRWRTSGNTPLSSVSSLVSGVSEPVKATPVVSQVPILAVPEGEYAYVALLRSSVPGTFPVDWMVRTGDTAAYFGPTFSGTLQATFQTANTWVMFPIETLTLPPARSKVGVVEVALSRVPVGAEVIDVDEQWIFRTGDDCALTIVSSSGSFLWLDSPGVDSAEPQVWQGLEGNKTDARHPGAELIAQGAHFLTPPATTVFTAASGAPKHSASATYYMSWHSNAAE